MYLSSEHRAEVQTAGPEHMLLMTRMTKIPTGSTGGFPLDQITLQTAGIWNLLRLLRQTGVLAQFDELFPAETPVEEGDTHGRRAAPDVGKPDRSP